MDQTRQAIPPDAITVGEAFELLFHVKFPDWRTRLAKPDCFKGAADFAQHGRDEREVTDLLYDGYRDGTIPFYLRDVSGEVLRLTGGGGKFLDKACFCKRTVAVKSARYRKPSSGILVKG